MTEWAVYHLALSLMKVNETRKDEGTEILINQNAGASLPPIYKHILIYYIRKFEHKSNIWVIHMDDCCFWQLHGNSVVAYWLRVLRIYTDLKDQNTVTGEAEHLVLGQDNCVRSFSKSALLQTNGYEELTC